MPTPTFDDLARASCRTVAQNGKGPVVGRQLSLDRTFAVLEEVVADIDERMLGAEAGCRCGNYSKAEERLEEAARLAQHLQHEVTRLYRRVVAAGVMTAWR